MSDIATFGASLLLYFGSYLVPAIYLVFSRFRGRATKAMIFGFAIHTFWNLAVWAFVYYSWRAGYSEHYWGWALLIPINFISFLYYIGSLLYGHGHSGIKLESQPQAEQGGGGNPAKPGASP